MNEDVFYLMALSQINGLAARRIKKLIRHFGNAQAVFEAPENQIIEWTNKPVAHKIKSFNDFNRVEREIRFAEKNNIEILTFLCDNYPRNLLHIPDFPVVLFKKGPYSFNNPRHLSIVGTRKITPYGKKITHQLINKLKDFNPVIVSGMAYGVDIEAHKAALDNELITVAVMGTSFNSVYPDAHLNYFNEITEKGCVLTEYWSDEQTDRKFFVKRNRIVAGISEATVIVESGIKGGALITGELAFEYNRDVFAVPGKITDTYSAGCNRLIQKNIAKILINANDIAESLNWSVNEKPTRPVQKQLFVELNPDEQKIYDFLQNVESEHLDIIALETRFPVSKTSQLLMMMELKGVVQSIPGKKFKLA